ncbi:hypothetical protein [Mycobacterium branderi]|uniref:Uncharacterized protein n=1 Tax=Mycobacterium branderi TaxID=43348 RepID=A0A7I7W3N4_9MYCO|nr:hypothetical protein [Mycobacterium branderi]MCV7230893.1 hypothetical protein [Mycobacterium branderi]ORA39036.1 hypothetical protein BST20_09795 [Mycobacterium branderi]BBZ12184.1 hypothetical protein MBRA_23790 [Mycobacterium branderi]
MRTAVVRIGVDPSGVLSPAELDKGMATLRELVEATGAEVLPVSRREVQLLIAGSDADAVRQTAVELCAKAFGTVPAPGVVTYVSRGTDDDARGVLAGFGLTGEIRRVAGDEGFDVVYVTLRQADLERIPESRVHTALEASLNCEVHILTT